ncbi:MAG: hypothetical protein HQP61_10270 [Peptococcaceae bacterium]|nr:hypothetical protein [Candidatus Syntrophopropionicum ammoniitolerans]
MGCLKKLTACVLALTLILGSGITGFTANAANAAVATDPAGPADATNGRNPGFSDIEGHWAKDQVLDWSEKGLVMGYADGTFKPEQGVTRAEFATFVNRAFGLKIKVQPDFSDVSPQDWFAEEVAMAVAGGYIGGYPDGTFRPDSVITRAETVALLSKAAGTRYNAPGAHRPQEGSEEVSETADVEIQEFCVTDLCGPFPGLFGYCVGFKLVDATAADVAEIVVTLYDGEEVIAINTSAGVLEECATCSSLYAPFDVLGEFDYEEDGGWEYSDWLGLTPVIPTTAEVTVTFKNGVEKTVTREDLAGDTAIFGKRVVNITRSKGYDEIQAAIDDANAGDTIKVTHGTYEGNLKIPVPGLTRKAEWTWGATLTPTGGFNYANGYGGITILADGVTIDSFNILQGDPQAIIHTHGSKDVKIINNRIAGLDDALLHGIDVGYASAASERVTIMGNWFEDLYCGVYVSQAKDLVISENYFGNMSEDAVVLEETQPMDEVTVTDNITDNEF